MSYDATTTRIFGMPSYSFFSVVGVTFASSLFILLLLKHGYSIPRYTKIFLLSGIGMLLGAKLFGFLTGLYVTFANNEPISLRTFLDTGIVFYGGLTGFLLSFLFICKKCYKDIEYRVVDIAVVCIPLFHFWGRLGCFSGGCCYGIETQSSFSIIYTTKIKEDIITATRVPIQLIEATGNLVIFIFLLLLLNIGIFKNHLLKLYLFMYAIMRISLEFFRGDLTRGIYHGVSFSQIVSFVIIIACSITLFTKKEKGYA